jgi:GNAT superfamily N-acetyltransferase
MSATARLRYYLGRCSDYLDEFGLPLRRRSLLFYGRPVDEQARPSLPYGAGACVQPSDREEFCRLRWLGDPIIPREAATWERPERRWPIVARDSETMDGFGWLEESVAEIRYFDLQCWLPARTLYLSRVWVYPTSRDRGIGRLMLEAAISHARQLGFDHVISACVPHNHRMRHLFQTGGWTYFQQVKYLRAGRAVRFSIAPASERPRHSYSAIQAAEYLAAGLKTCTKTDLDPSLQKGFTA